MSSDPLLQTFPTITRALMVAKRNMDHEYRSRIEKQIRDARGILFGENIPISDEDLQQKLVVWSGQVSAWNCLVDRFPTAAEAARDWKAELKDASLAALACHNADDAQRKRNDSCS